MNSWAQLKRELYLEGNGEKINHIFIQFVVLEYENENLKASYATSWSRDIVCNVIVFAYHQSSKTF